MPDASSSSIQASIQEDCHKMVSLLRIRLRSKQFSDKGLKHMTAEELKELEKRTEEWQAENETLTEVLRVIDWGFRDFADLLACMYVMYST